MSTFLHYDFGGKINILFVDIIESLRDEMHSSEKLVCLLHLTNGAFTFCNILSVVGRFGNLKWSPIVANI